MSTPEINPVGSSSYVILPDGTVARKLKPTIVNGKPYWNLSTGKGTSKRVSLSTIQKYIDAMANTQKQDHQTSNS